MAVFNPLIFSVLYIVPVRVISTFVVNLLAKIQKDFDNESTFPAFFEKRLKKLEVSEIIPIFEINLEDTFGVHFIFIYVSQKISTILTNGGVQVITFVFI